MQMNIGLYSSAADGRPDACCSRLAQTVRLAWRDRLNGSLVNPGRTRTSNPLNWEDLLQHRLTLLVSQNHHPDVILGGGPQGGHKRAACVQVDSLGLRCKSRGLS